jgi:exonuclease SbcC
LDSLFLDEGFGTLDPEALEVVVEAIEQLGGDGRMVGVITHIQELAARLPARIEIEKSPRGSVLSVSS